MNVIAAPRILLKVAPAAGVRALGVAGTTVPIRELCPNEWGGTPGAAAAARPRWYIADFGGPVNPAGAWDVAYEAARANGAYAEPDIGRQWEYYNPVRLEFGAAPGDLCAYNDQSPDFPRGPGFAWHLDASGLRAARAEIEQLPNRASVRIGILDTGFDPRHNARPERILEELQRNFTRDGRPESDASDPYERGPFTNPGHGTGTIGLLAGRRLENMARPEQNGDYLGGAPFADILPVRIADRVVLLYTSAFAAGLDYLIAPNGNAGDRVDVVSMSMGGMASRAWADVVNRAYEAGIAMVTAAGNNFPLTPESIVYPARFRRVIAACGVMADGRPYIRGNVPAGAMAGNYGPQSKMDNSALAAYTPNTSWAEINCGAIVDMDGSGTSSATPQVAAAAALWLQKYKDSMAAWEGWEKVEAVRNALFMSAATDSPDSSKYFGKGILRAGHALALAPARAPQPQPADSAILGFWKVILDRGIPADPIRSEMLGVEAAQLFQIDPDVAATMEDPDAAGAAPPKFFDAVIASPHASGTLKNAVRQIHPSAAVPGADLGKPAPPERPRNQIVPSAKPESRRLRVYAIDPSLSTALETASMNEIAVPVPWEEVSPGPVGEYIEVIDHDLATGCFYAPVDLNEQELLASDGLAPNAGDPRFHQQMVYAVAMRTIRNFETALGRTALWSPLMTPGDPDDSHYVGQLRIYPHALRERNAYYNPDKKALLFGYFPARQAQPGDVYPNGITFTCLSHDIVAHETTHALLDGMHRNFNLDGPGDATAFHEAFADLVALLQHFSLPQVLEYSIGRTRGDMRIDNLLAQIGQEFGIASGLHKALRSALGRKPDPTALAHTTEPHQRGAILVSAVFDAFVAMYNKRTSDLVRLASGGSGILRPGALHPDLLGRLAEEARQTAQHVLSMCIRALDYCPAVDITFGEYLRAIVTADFELSPESVLDYRVAFVEAFRSWGLYPSDLQTLSPESLRWRGLQFPESQAILSRILGAAREFAEKSRYLAWSTERRFRGMPLRQRIFVFSREWREKLHDTFAAAIPKLSANKRAKLGLDLGLDFSTGRERFEVHALRLSEKIGSDGQMQCDLILQVLQHRPETSASGPFVFSGGSTVIADPRSLEVRYSIPKNIGNAARLALARESIEGAESARQLYFGGTPFTAAGERFAVVHRMAEED